MNVEQLTARVKELEALVHVPGLWRCDKCQFNLMRSTLNVTTGRITADDAPNDVCPNCETELRPVTEREAGNDVVDRCSSLAERLANASQKIKNYRKALAPFAAMDRRECDLKELACSRGVGCDLTIIISADFRRAKQAMDDDLDFEVTSQLRDRISNLLPKNVDGCRVCTGTGPNSIGSSLCDEHELEFQNWLREKFIDNTSMFDEYMVVMEEAAMKSMQESMRSIQEEAESKGLNAPRISLAHIEQQIDYLYFFTAADGIIYANKVQSEEVKAHIPKVLNTITYCVMIMKTGATITGESKPASLENYDADLGCKAARESAIRKAWELEGYRLAALARS